MVILLVSVILATAFNIYFDNYSPHTGQAVDVRVIDGGGGGGGSSSVVCGDSNIGSGEECDGTNLNSATCISKGYISGTLSCDNSCDYNYSGCSNCGNDICDVGETCSGCLADCEGNQSDCSAGQLCTSVMGSGTCIAAAPSICNDTTSVNSCSSVSGAPWYCNSNTTLVENCSTCGCLGESTCDNSTGTCFNHTFSSIVGIGGSGNSGSVYTIEDAAVSITTTIDSAGSGAPLSWGSLSNNDVVEFEINSDVTEINNRDGSLDKEIHRFKVVKFSRARKTVHAIISSDPIDVVLYEGESQRIDVDGDGVEDVIVLASNIGLSNFDIDIQEIDKEKLIQENQIEESVTKIRERKVFFPELYLSPVFEESPEANLYEFIIVNALILMGMVLFFFRFAKEIKKR